MNGTVKVDVIDPAGAPTGGPKDGKYIVYHGTNDAGATGLETKGIDSNALKNPNEFQMTIDPNSAATFGADEVAKSGGTVKLVRYEISEDLFTDLFNARHIKPGSVGNSVGLDKVAQDSINKAMGL